MRLVSAIVAAAIGLSVANAAKAKTVDINFDDLTTGTEVGAAYSALGVTFSNALVYTPTINSSKIGMTLPNAIYSVNMGGKPQQIDPISASFSVAATSVTLRGIDIGAGGFIFKAFDAAGTMIDTVSYVGTGTGPGVFRDLTVTGEAIARVDFSQVNLAGADGIWFDNFSFDYTPVPLPAGAVLLIGGLGALAGFRKREAD
ncbi:VPLPA-CTERM sorting domain-containing protein [Primorskyibacter flagellatus]|nr:VPLPA-CTERM sorting domain-containing protein [Primorskyibacter flagellatus]